MRDIVLFGLVGIIVILSVLLCNEREKKRDIIYTIKDYVDNKEVPMLQVNMSRSLTGDYIIKVGNCVVPWSDQDEPVKIGVEGN